MQKENSQTNTKTQELKYPFVVGFRCDLETKNKLDELFSCVPLSRAEWLKNIVNKEYNALQNDKKHPVELGVLFDALESMVILMKAYRFDRAKVKQCENAIVWLKEYLSNLGN